MERRRSPRSPSRGSPTRGTTRRRSRSPSSSTSPSRTETATKHRRTFIMLTDEEKSDLEEGLLKCFGNKCPKWAYGPEYNHKITIIIWDISSTISLSNGMFRPFKNLKKIFFTKHPSVQQTSSLTQIPYDLFYGLTKLEELQLSYTKISTFHPDTFSKLPNLKMLVLSSNNLTEVPNLKKLKKLIALGLYNNSISEISEDAFKGLPLEEIDLSNNELTVININTFLETTSEELLFVDLDRNKIPVYLFPSYKNVENHYEIEFSLENQRSTQRYNLKYATPLA